MYGSNSISGTKRIYCNSCSRETKHDIMVKRRVNVPIKENKYPMPLYLVQDNKLLQCCGCEAVTYLVESTLLDDLHFQEEQFGSAKAVRMHCSDAQTAK